jgi:hypothetical protein
VDPAGKPVRLTTNVTVAAVTLPAESLVVTNVIEAVPLTVDSLLVTGGTSFAGERVAVKVGLVGDVLLGVVEELLQPAAQSASARATGDNRVIVRLSFCQ